MASKRSNKKRNTLLVFEFLAKEASKRIVLGDEPGSRKIVDLMKKSFAQGTELHKEYRLANALLVTQASKDSVASNIMTEARKAAMKLDQAKLNAEKTSLIVALERLDPSGSLYEAPLGDYKLRSTIGSLINYWNSGTEDIAKLASYENRLVEHLLEPRVQPTQVEEMPAMSSGEKRALMSVMSRKLEERYGNELTKDQKNLLREYALCKDPSQMLVRLNEIREQAIRVLASSEQEAQPDETYYKQRLRESREYLSSEVFHEADDATVSKCMVYLKLVSEALEKEDKS